MISRSRGYLPHFESSAATYFVTFRLADSLPTALLLSWKAEMQHKISLDKTKYEIFAHEYNSKIEKYIDSGYGNCWLKNPEIASLVRNALRYFDKDRYVLHTWTLMPNHVHVLITLLENSSLSKTLHSWKSFTSKKANQLLGLSGQFWQPEYFDRLIKSERQFEFTLRYILNNPVKAGLCKEFQEWPWFGLSPDMMPLVDRFFGYKDAGKMPAAHNAD
jgi:REP element-mobilizing transposase RayT